MKHANMTDTISTLSALKKAIEDACENDDFSRALERLDMAALAKPNAVVARSNNLQKTLQRGLKYSARNNSVGVMRCLIELGADVNDLPGSYLVDIVSLTSPSRETLKVLLEHGWDINSRIPKISGTPILWYTVEDSDLVKFCLDNGAEVDPEDDTPEGSKKERKPILEVAASGGNIESFELLRAKGAPVSYNFGILPTAVMSAGYSLNQAGQGSDTHYARMLNMIRHLLDVVGCDVNSISYGMHYGSGSFCSTPLCWLACRTNDDGVRELVRLLLDRGGDVDLSGPTIDNVRVQSAREGAQQRPNRPFLDAVAEWEAEHRDRLLKAE